THPLTDFSNVLISPPTSKKKTIPNKRISHCQFILGT
ncbi:MAG: hypothetical protein ACI9K1_002315, partial [Arcticibacterium sp.]